MLLALETATDVCSVAYKDANGEVHEKRTETKGSHSEKLFLFIEELMHEQGFNMKDLEAVIVSEGPGSYTGLRISASAVKGLFFQSSVTLFGANTLASFAYSAALSEPGLRAIHSIIDARRVHVYHQQFKLLNGGLSAVDDLKIIPIKEFEKTIEAGDGIAGTGFKRLDKNILKQTIIFDQTFISARSLIGLYESDHERHFLTEVGPQDFEPRYYTSLCR